jgi:hypothetical protein
MQKHATVRPPVVELLLEMCKCCDLYLMETVLDDKSEVQTYLQLCLGNALYQYFILNHLKYDGVITIGERPNGPGECWTSQN